MHKDERGFTWMTEKELRALGRPRLLPMVLGAFAGIGCAMLVGWLFGLR